MIGEVLGQPNRQGSPLDIAGGEVVASGFPSLTRANQSEGPGLLSHLVEPGQHDLRNGHHRRIAVLGLVWNVGFLVHAEPRPAHQAGLVVAHAHQELCPDEEVQIMGEDGLQVGAALGNATGLVEPDVFDRVRRTFLYSRRARGKPD